MATATLFLSSGLKIRGIKLVRSESNPDEVIVYNPSIQGRDLKKYSDSAELPEGYKKTILEKYRGVTSEKNKTGTDGVVIVPIRQKILFHFYHRHKESMTQLRIWFLARLLDSAAGSGRVTIDELSRAIGIGTEYIRRKCAGSEFFRHIGDFVYYSSPKKIIKSHKLPVKIPTGKEKRGKKLFVWNKIRGEKVTRAFFRQIKSKKGFEAYITKCYMERDLSKRLRKYTYGRISNEGTAARFGISRRTVITNIKRSKAKIFKNEKSYFNKVFKDKQEYGNWLRENMDSYLDKQRIVDCGGSIALKKVEGGFMLVRRLPNIFKFTGVYLVGERSYRRGKSRRKS